MRTLAILMAWVLAPCSWADGVAIIPVVHTWGELSATTPIVLKELTVGQPVRSDGKPPVEFWVGIDRDHMGEYGTAVLYCLAKGNPRFFNNSPRELGPFTVDVENSKLKIWDIDSVRMAQMKAASLPNEYTLYVQTVPVEMATTYTINLKYDADANAAQKQPRIIAHLNLKASADKNAAFWSPWGNSPKEDDREAHGGSVDSGEGFVQMIVCNPIGGVASPKTPPEGITIGKLPAPATLLPVLIPEKSDPATVLQLVGDTLVVTLPQGLKDEEDPDEDFLTRWWINGKPWQPDPQKAEFQQRAREEARAMLAGGGPKRIHFQLDFHPERLGVKKGDVVGVQLLFCPEGWASNSPLQRLNEAVDMLALMAGPPPPPPASVSFASNRVEFTYSGDPASPVK